LKARKLTSALAAMLATAFIALGAATPAAAAPAAVRGTPVTRVPSLQHHIVGQYRPGQRAVVTGLSDDYNWWRIRCPWGGTCWVSANPNYSRPVAWW